MFNIFKRKQKIPGNLNEVLKQLEGLEDRILHTEEEIKNIKERDKSHIQKIGVVRFNPFKGVGGDQSFSIALFDENNNGFVITSLYGREGHRIYAKPIEGGISKYQLSDEEKEAIQRALGS